MKILTKPVSKYNSFWCWKALILSPQNHKPNAELHLLYKSIHRSSCSTSDHSWVTPRGTWTSPPSAMYYLLQHTLPWSPVEDFLATVLPSPADTNDSVTRVIDSTRVMIFGDSDSTRVRLRKMVTRIESQSMTRDSSQSHFCKISEPLNQQTQFLHTKK